MTHKNIILLSIIVGLAIGMIGSIYDPNLKAFAQKEEKKIALSAEMIRSEKMVSAIDIMDRELKHVDQKFIEIKEQLNSINQKIATICDDIVTVRIKSAESGGIYGGGSAVIIYLIGIFGKSIWSKIKK